MQDNRKPSKAMVKKLLEIQHIDIEKSMVKLLEIMPTLNMIGKEARDQLIAMAVSSADVDMAVNYITNSYARELTANDVLDLISFYKSSAGQRILAVQEKLNNETISIIYGIVLQIVIDLFSMILMNGTQSMSYLDAKSFLEKLKNDKNNFAVNNGPNLIDDLLQDQITEDPPEDPDQT
jgi:hypothetical protein